MKRKGISPVIAVLLLIVIAVAAAILTYVWITGYMGTLQSQAGTQQIQERLKIEGVSIQGDDTIGAIYVRNIGDITVEVSAIYLMDNTGNVLRMDELTTTESIDPGDTKSFGDATDVDVHLDNVPGYTLTSGDTYIIKVVTVKGTEVTYQFTYRE